MPVDLQQLAAQTGLSRSRAYALLRLERARTNGDGYRPFRRTTSDNTATAPSSPK